MTDIQQRIADILHQHLWWLAGNLGIPGMPDQTTYKCDCGWNGDDPRAHVAEAITTELRLTPETRYIKNDGTVSRVPAKNSHAYEQRWTTGWGRAE